MIDPRIGYLQMSVLATNEGSGAITRELNDEDRSFPHSRDICGRIIRNADGSLRLPLFVVSAVRQVEDYPT